MTIKINADTSTGLELESDTSGIIDIQSGGTTKMTVGTTIDVQGNELVLDADADTSIHADTDDEIDFKTAGTDRMKVNGVGQVYIGTTVERNNSFVCIKSDATNQNGMEIRCHANNDAIRFYSSDSTSAGAVTVSGSSTTYSTSSDYRLKENVSYTWDATTRLKQLKPCRFNWIADDTNTELDGFIAHEVSSIVPESIIGEKDAEQMQGIDQSKLVPLLVKTIQELEARITALESE